MGPVYSYFVGGDPQKDQRQDLNEARAQFKEFSRLVAKAIREKKGEEEVKYKEEREFWLGRVRELETQLRGTGIASSLAPKRPLPSVQDDDDERGVKKFMRSSILHPLPFKAFLNLDPTVPLEKRMMPLSLELNDQEGLPQWILFRRCFSEYLEKHIRPALEGKRNVFIGGAQGIGKSVFTDILALVLVQEGEVVLLEHFEKRLLLVGEKSNPKALNEVKSVLTKSMIYDPDSVSASKPGVYVIESDVLFNSLVETTHLIVIQDLGSTQGKTVNFDGRTRKIWISSPNAEKLKPIRGDGRRVDLCVPPMTIEEMLQIREQWNPNGYSEKQVKERSARYGGSVRMVLEFDALRSKREVEKAIAEATNDTLRATFFSTLLNLPKGTMSGLLLHPIPRPGDPTDFQLRFASDQIGRRLYDKFVSVEKRSVGTFVAVAREYPELGAFAGYVLEDNIHGRILQGIEVVAKPLGKRANAEAQRKVSLPTLILKAPFTEEDFSDIKLEDLVENAYFRPTSTSFPTIDSFAILPLSIFIPGASGLCLVSIQSTVSRSHITEGYILERLYKQVQRKWPNIARYHVFVTGPNGIRTKQKVDMEKAEGGSYKEGHEPKVEQWAMTLGDEFDELFDRLESQESGLAFQAN